MLIDLPDPENLPQTPVLLKQQVNDWRQMMMLLLSEIADLKRKLSGRKSEKISREDLRRQLLLFEEDLGDLVALIEEQLTDEEAAKLQGSDRVKRRPRRLGFSPDIPREEVIHTLSEDEQKCLDCGSELKKIGQQTSEQLEYVPAQFKVFVHIRPTFACPCCHANVVTPPPVEKPIPKGIPGPGLLAQIIVSKYGHHLPLFRQQEIYGPLGATLPVSTMSGWVAQCAALLTPIHQVMIKDVLRSKVVHTDDTPVRVQPQHSISETGKGRLWPYVGDADHPHVVFDYTTSRGRDGPSSFLSGFSGYLQADAYAAYDGIYAGGQVIEVGCWAHARRYFEKAQGDDPKRASVFLALIQNLFRIERKGKHLSTVERQTLRQQKSVPLLDQIGLLLIQYQGEVLPKGPMGKAIRYVKNQWKALIRFLENGNLDLDNNAAERAIRPIAIGRKNWLFVGSDESGRWTAVLYGLLMSCRLHDIDPLEYLKDVLLRIHQTQENRIWELTPFAWKAQRENNPAPPTPALTPTLAVSSL